MQTSLSTNIRSCLVINQSATCFSPSPAPVPRGGCQLGFRRSVFNTGGGFSGQAVSGRRFLFAFRGHFPRGGKPFASLTGKVRKERHVATLSALCPTHPFMSLCPPPLPNVPLAGLSEATIHSKKIHSSRILSLDIIPRWSHRRIKGTMAAQKGRTASPL